MFTGAGGAEEVGSRVLDILTFTEGFEEEHGECCDDAMVVMWLMCC